MDSCEFSISHLLNIHCTPGQEALGSLTYTRHRLIKNLALKINISRVFFSRICCRFGASIPVLQLRMDVRVPKRSGVLAEEQRLVFQAQKLKGAREAVMEKVRLQIYAV